MAAAPSRIGSDGGTQPLHIVHVITRLLLGGAEENTVSTCVQQAGKGHRVTLIHGPHPHPSWADRLAGKVELVEVPTLVHPIDPPTDARAIRELRKLYKQLRPDVVHTHQSKAGIVGRLAAARAQVPLVVHTVHIAPFLNVTGARRRFYVAAEKACARVTDLFIAVSHGMRSAYIDEGIGRDRPFEVIRSGMPLDTFTNATAPADWRERIGGWDGADRPRFLLKLAAFEPRKRHRELIQALAPQLRERPDVCLLLGGQGQELERCKAEARALGVERQVRFLGHDPKPQELIALADICLFTSAREGLPRSAVQYIAGGKPVVISRLPGIDELIANGENGIVTPPDDLGEVATSAFGLLDDKAGRARLMEGARNTDVSPWAEAAMGDSIDLAYRRARHSVAAFSAGAADAEPITAIEFFGVPGGGKTTVARELLTLLQQANQPVAFSGDLMGDHLPLWRRSLLRLLLVLRELPANGFYAVRCGRGLVGEEGLSRKGARTVWNFGSTLALGLRHQRAPKELLVIDQGLVQALWTARMRHSGAGSAPLAGLPQGRWLGRTLFVHVEAPTDLARARLEERKSKTSQMQEPEHLQRPDVWNRADLISQQLAAEVSAELNRRSLGSRLLHIRNDGAADPRQLALSIVRHLPLSAAAGQRRPERPSERLNAPTTLAAEIA